MDKFASFKISAQDRSTVETGVKVLESAFNVLRVSRMIMTPDGKVFVYVDCLVRSEGATSN